MPESSIRVLLADDHSIVRKGLRSTLENETGIQVVGEAANGRETVRLCAQLKPSIAVIDIGMPQLNGIDAAAQVGKVSPSTRVIILSMHTDETYILRALTAGAKGYLLKDTAEDDLLPAASEYGRWEERHIATGGPCGGSTTRHFYL